MNRKPWLLFLLVLAGEGCRRTEVVPSFPEDFVGVGMELRMAGDLPEVVRTLPGSSADEAGILAGDRIVRIDGRPTRGETLGNVVMGIRGQPNTQVTLTLHRGAERLIVVIRRRQMAKRGKKGYEPAAH